MNIKNIIFITMKNHTKKLKMISIDFLRHLNLVYMMHCDEVLQLDVNFQ